MASIVLLGASGATGRAVIRAALLRGHPVTAVVRSAGACVPTAGLTEVAVGDPGAPGSLDPVMQGCDAVISTVGPRGRGPSSVCAGVVGAALDSMARAGVRRLVAVSAHGVAESRDRSPYSLAVWAAVGNKLRDKEAMEALIRASGADWTIVRPPALRDGAATGRYRTGEDLRIGLRAAITRADLADFLVREAVAGRQLPAPRAADRGMSRAGVTGGHRVPVDLRGRTALVTGGTGGMGRVVVTELARAGARVVTVSRDGDRGTRLRQRIGEEIGADRVEVLVGDLSVRADLRAIAERVAAGHPELHLLVNNAGAHYRHRTETRDGVERHLAVNHLAGFTLTYLLQERLLGAGSARVVNVVSDTMNDTRTLKLWGPPRPVDPGVAGITDLRRISPAAGFVPFEAYARAKLLTTICGQEFAERLARGGVLVNAVHPGIVSTGIIDDLVPAPMRPLRPLLHRLLLTPEQGAASVLRLAAGPEVTTTGGYYRRGTPAPPPPATRDRALAERVWTLSRDWVDAG